MRPLSDRLRTIIKRHPIVTVTIAVLTTIVLLIPIVFVGVGRQRVYRDANDIPETEYAIVFGAGVTENGVPSAALRDRLTTTIALYEEDRIAHILVSGDNSGDHHYETDVMKDYLTGRGVPLDSILVDDAGLRTYDTCRNAKEAYDIDKALLITQGFHLPRALFLCNNLGVESSGFSATRRDYLYENIHKLREILAIYKSLLDVYLLPRS